MKKIIITLMLVFFFSVLIAQEKGVYYNGEKISPTKISSIKATAGASIYLTGIGSVKTRAVIIGKTSKNKINAGELNFTMKFGTEVVDDFSSYGLVNQIASPSDLLLFKLQIKNGARNLLIGSLGTFTGSSIGLDPEGAIPFEYESLGDGDYKVTIDSDIFNGEYAFVHSSWTGVYTKLWAFTVVESKKLTAYQLKEKERLEKKAERKRKREENKNKNTTENNL